MISLAQHFFAVLVSAVLRDLYSNIKTDGILSKLHRALYRISLPYCLKSDVSSRFKNKAYLLGALSHEKDELGFVERKCDGNSSRKCKKSPLKRWKTSSGLYNTDEMNKKICDPKSPSIYCIKSEMGGDPFAL